MLRTAREVPENLADPSLADGSCGLAILCTWLERWRGGQGFRALAEHHLETALEHVANRPLGPGLFQGLAGVAWTLRLLEVEGADDLVADIDRTLTAWAGGLGEGAPFDRVSGLAGVGAYALGPGEIPATLPLLTAVVEALLRCARLRDGRVLWALASPGSALDLGPAHGLPGVLGFLAQAQEKAPQLASRIQPLLEGGMAELLARRNPPDAPSMFPALVPLGERGPELGPGRQPSTRIGWCYGDLGTGFVLLAMGRRLGRAQWTSAGLAALRRAATRALEEAGMMDACICHGGAGNAHLFNRVYQATGEPLFRAATLAHFRWTLDFQHPDRGVGGFPKRIAPEADGSPGWAEDPGVLIGGAGVALALLAGLSELEPRWDGFLVDPL